MYLLFYQRYFRFYQRYLRFYYIISDCKPRIFISTRHLYQSQNCHVNHSKRYRNSKVSPNIHFLKKMYLPKAIFLSGFWVHISAITLHAAQNWPADLLQNSSKTTVKTLQKISREQMQSTDRNLCIFAKSSK